MAYCTQADVEMAAGGPTFLRELTDWENGLAVNKSVIDSAIAEADAWLNRALSKRYDVPVEPPVPEAIKRLSANEAVYVLKARRGLISETDIDRKKERDEELADMREGRTTPGVLPLPPKSSLVRDRYTARPADKAVSRNKLKGFW